MEYKREKQRMLKNYLQTMRFLGDTNDEVLYLYDLDEEKVYFSNDISQKYKIAPSKDYSYTLEELKTVVSSKSYEKLLLSLDAFENQEDEIVNQEYCMVAKDGKDVLVQSAEKLQFDEAGNPMWIIGRFFSPVDNQNIDSWTGLPNVNQMLDDLQACIEKKEKGFLVILGIDDFKKINNRYGRGYGNHILKNLSEVIENILEDEFKVYRLDGDKFAINGAGLSLQSVEMFYGAIQKRATAFCNLSSGVAEYLPEIDLNAEGLYQRAEYALDRAKKNGKNKQEIFLDNLYEAQMENIALEEELRHSIFHGFEGFSIVYQPQIDAKDFKLKGAEALLRYRSATKGPISPIEFIAILEQNHLIGIVGEWVLKEALIQCKKWRKELPDFHVSVNFSYIQLRSKVISEHIIRLLKENGLPGSALTLEVTESAQLDDYQFFNKIFYKLEKYGVSVAVDDFGTGYSSLSYLKSIAINEIKIDRCFVTGIQHSAYNYRLLANMIELAHSVNVRVCCEGVETEEELQVLKELNSDLLQGYLFSKPLTPKELEQKYIAKDSQEYKEREKAEMRYCLLGTSEVMKGEKENVEHQKMTSIVDGMEEIVYVSDSDTYDLFYMNDAGRTLTGTYDYRGRKCYEVLQGRKTPCELCGKCGAKSEEFHVWEIDNEYLKKHFIVKDKLISWSGRNANLTICIDITEKEDVSQKIQQKLEFEENIVAATTMLSVEKDKSKAINETLRMVGEFYQANRAYLFELQDNEEFWDNTYEWCAEGVESEIELLQDVPIAVTKRWVEIFKAGESVVIKDLEEIKEISPEEYEILASQNISNMIVAPIWNDEKVIGFLGVDDPKRYAENVMHIQAMAHFVVERLQKDITKQRLSELLTFHSEDILKITGLGLWSIRINPNGGRNQMFVDKTMMDLLGLKKALTPEECYEHWYNRINDGYFHYINEAVSEMIDHGKLVELSYTWKHPVKGEVTVRCIGRRVADSDGMICLEGYHRDINGLERKNYMEEEKNVIFEYHENHHTIYFHTEREYIFGDEEREECFPANWISQGIVHPHFAKKFEDVFIDVKGQPELEYEEFLLKTKNGAYDWFYLSTKDLSKDVKDADTMIIILEPASTERAEELQHLRVQDFYKAILNEKVAWMEVDMESRHILNLGGAWGVYREEALNGKCDYLELMMRYKEDLIHPDDKLAYAEFIGVGLESAMKSENHTKKLEYRRLLDGRMQWLEITAHIFKEQYSENMFALLYLKNIDAQKRKELEQETAATRDALTGVFNRAVFKYHVEMHMSENEELEDSTLLLLDIDNFKQINDTYGHAEGDHVIKQLSNALMKTFRRKDLLGRFGGDEFMVFLKNVTNREVINRRIEEFCAEFKKNSEYQCTCSIGIATAKKENFSYEEVLKKADDALYRSKKDGKNRYTYYE